MTTIDDAGNAVRLEQSARRIVSLTPHLTELAFEAGAGAHVIGAAAHSDFPPQATAIARIGDAHALDLERIVALRPDLILAWASGSPKRALGRLRAMGYPVFLHEPYRLEDIASAIERLGALAGTSTVARNQAQRFRERLSALRDAAAGQPPVRVFYQVWGRPLLTVSSDHVIADALATCGARNIFASQGARLPQPSREAVVLADPDVIVVAAAAGDAQALEAWRRWPRLRAVRRDHLYTVDPSLMHRHSARVLDGVSQLCGHIGRSARDR